MVCSFHLNSVGGKNVDIKKEKELFELKNQKTFNSSKLSFHGVDGFDVYNCSQPFNWKGKNYLFGRVEKRNEWMRSWVRLFEQTGIDEWTVVPNSMIYQLEDPYISVIDNMLVFGGTHVRMNKNELDTYYGYFYKGVDVDNLYYFTTGPDYMKDIRLVQLADGKIGVFSRPRNKEILKKYGSESMVGFSTINSLDELDSTVIQEAKLIPGLFSKNQWGGCNQAYLLESGKIGVLGHASYEDDTSQQSVYANMAFVFDPDNHKVLNYHIIATRNSYPKGDAKKSNLKDCAFTSGLIVREDGMVDLYSGIGDCEEGKVTIPYPFEGYGNIVEKNYKIL